MVVVRIKIQVQLIQNVGNDKKSKAIVRFVQKLNVDIRLAHFEFIASMAIHSNSSAGLELKELTNATQEGEGWTLGWKAEISHLC